MVILGYAGLSWVILHKGGLSWVMSNDFKKSSRNDWQTYNLPFLSLFLQLE